MKDGIYPAIRREDYDRIERVNFSTLKIIDCSPAHYRHALVSPPEDTDPKRLGRAVHLAAFEPQRFQALVAVWDGNVRRGKDWDAFCEKNAGRELLTFNQYEKCVAIQKAVRSDAIAMRYLSNGRGEISMLWTHEALDRGVNSYSLACKGRIDFDAQSALVDLKVTHDASRAGFARQVVNLHYHTQEAWYSDAYFRLTGKRKPSVIVAIENEAPYVVTVFRVPERVLRLGREKYSLWMDQLAFCRETNQWPPYAEEEVELELPPWAQPEEDALSELTSGGAALVGE